MTIPEEGRFMTVDGLNMYVIPEGRYIVDIDDVKHSKYQIGPEFPGESRIAIFKNSPYGLGIFPTWVTEARGYDSVEEALQALPAIHAELMEKEEN